MFSSSGSKSEEHDEPTSISVMVVGDPHFDVKHLGTVDLMIKQTIVLVEREKPDVVIILGDVLHTHEKTRVECHQRAVFWFKKLAELTHVVVLIGNHDRPNNGVYLTNEHFFNGLEGIDNLVIVAIAPYGCTIERNKAQFYFVAIPFVPKGRMMEALSLLKTPIEQKRPVAVFAHQDIRGAKMGAVECRDGDVWPSDYPLLVNGHFHEAQTFGNVFMPGTPYQTTYSEENKKGVYFLTFTEKQPIPKIRRVALNLRVKASVNKTPAEFKAMKMPDTTYDLRIVVQGKQEEIESLRVSQQYKQFCAAQHIKVVLCPILEAISIKNSVGDNTSYMAALHARIQGDQELLDLYQELFSDLQ